MSLTIEPISNLSRNETRQKRISIAMLKAQESKDFQKRVHVDNQIGCCIEHSGDKVA